MTVISLGGKIAGVCLFQAKTMIRSERSLERGVVQASAGPLKRRLHLHVRLHQNAPARPDGTANA